MTFSRHFSFGFVLVAILCIIVLFFFPGVEGPYSALHGPVTVLVSLKAKLCLCLALLLAAMHLLGRSVAVSRALRIPLDKPFLSGLFDPYPNAVLRC